MFGTVSTRKFNEDLIDTEFFRVRHSKKHFEWVFIRVFVDLMESKISVALTDIDLKASAFERDNLKGLLVYQKKRISFVKILHFYTFRLTLH